MNNQSLKSRVSHVRQKFAAQHKFVMALSLCCVFPCLGGCEAMVMSTIKAANRAEQASIKRNFSAAAKDHFARIRNLQARGLLAQRAHGEVAGMLAAYVAKFSFAMPG